MKLKNYLPIAGILIFIYILIKVNFLEIIKEISNANIYFILLSIILVFIMLIIQTFKWYIIAVFQGIKIGFGESYKINLISNFYGFVTPSKIGTLMRVEYLKKYTKNVGKGLCNFILDKILDFGSLIFIVIVFSFVFREKMNLPIGFFMTVLVILILITLFFIGKDRSKFVLKFFYKNIIPEKIKENFEKIEKSKFSKKNFDAISFGNINHSKFSKEKAKLTFDSFYESIPKKRYFIIFFSLNLINWIILYWISYLIGLSLGINLNFIYFLAILPIGTFVSMIPISINGLGTREAVLISLFGLFGISSAKIFSMSIITFFISGIIPAVVGWLFILSTNYIPNPK